MSLLLHSFVRADISKNLIEHKIYICFDFYHNQTKIDFGFGRISLTSLVLI